MRLPTKILQQKSRLSALWEESQRSRGKLGAGALAYVDSARETLAETFWPTRCALCDCPGTLLCEKCLFELSYIDHWRRCERCGAPFGAVQCSECNPVVMADLGMKKPPYTACVSVANFDAASARLITTYKDKNEQRLASALGSMMCEVIPPKWLEVNPDMQISFVPASAKALRRRGFDHAELLAREVGWGLSLPVTSLFERPASKDQRSLTRHERIFNMEQRFRVLEKELPRSILLVDDVYTTGSTLSFASKKLLERGAKSVYCLTFARVW